MHTVLFDLDGTLIYSRDAILSSISATLEEFGHGPLTEEDVGLFVGTPLSEALGHWTKDPAPMVRRFQEIYLRDFEETTRIFPGMIDVLDTLRSRSNMCIITLKRNSEAQEVLEKLGLSKYFKYVFGDDAEDSPYQIKPHPQHYFYALRTLGIIDKSIYEELESETDLRGGPAPFDTTGVVFVGDTEADMIGAKRAGIAALGVTWGVHDAKRLKGAGADATVDSPEELMGYMRKTGFA